MNQELPEQGVSNRNPANVRPTREMLGRRTVELAGIAGRGPLQIKQADYERAKRELTGESDFDRQLAALDSRW